MIRKKLDTPMNDSTPHSADGDVPFPAPLYKKMKDIHEDERPREKAMRSGCGALTVPELWALILGSGTRGVNIVDLCSDLMARNDNHLSMLLRRSLNDLLEIRGLGPKKALQVMAVLELVKRFNQEGAPVRPTIRTSLDIYNVMRNEIAFIGHEEIWILLLNRANKVFKIQQVSEGSATAAVFDVKRVMKEALMENAEGLVLCHNHPSGHLAPSGQDDHITSMCKHACETMSMRFLDHVIVCVEGYYSYADNGRL